MQKTKKIPKTVRLAELAMFIAIIIIMAFTPQLGYFRHFGLEITLIVIPVAVGATVLGPDGGAVLGAVFGITSFLQCFKSGSFGWFLLQMSPIKTFIMCFVPRLLVGFLTGLIFSLLKNTKAKKLAEVISCLCCPLLNTVLFMTFLTSFFYSTDYIRGFAITLNAHNPITFIILFVGVQGLIEAAVCFVIGTAVSKAVVHVNNKQLSKF